jgi:3-oxoacyl-[acyl-carrier-protein] synthase III
MKAVLSAVTAYLPEKVLTNQEISTFLDTSDEWILTRTGIRERRIFDRLQTDLKSSDIAAEVALKLLRMQNLDPLKIDVIILGSMYPDFVFPSTACVVQGMIGAHNALAFDITAACGFIPLAIQQGDMMIRAGQAKNVLIIGAELSSRVVDWTDRNTCVLFGDGAGALLLTSVDDSDPRGVIASTLKSDGRFTSILQLKKDEVDQAHFLEMDGKSVFKIAVNEMADSVKETLNKAGLQEKDIDWLIPHQANIRILDATAKKLGLPAEKLIVNVDRYGNTSSASIPIALMEAVESGKIKQGDLIALVAVGGGMNWGCNLIRY